MQVLLSEEQYTEEVKLRLVTYPDTRLTTKCVPVEKIDKEFRSWVHDMIFICRAHHGIGIAAPQVGILQNFFYWKFSPNVVINPIIRKRKGQIHTEESCLSLPNLVVPVRRSESIEVTFYDMVGKEYNEKYKGERAVVFQHEWDHLQGRLITFYQSGNK